MWKWIIKNEFAYLCYDAVSGIFNNDIVDRIYENVARWMEPTRLNTLKQARVHKRGHLKSLSIGRVPPIADLEKKVNQILDCVLDKNEFVSTTVMLQQFSDVIKESEEYTCDPNTNAVKKRDKNGEFGDKVLLKLNEPYIRRFMKRYDWISANTKMNTRLDVKSELERFGPHWIMLNSLFLVVGQDVTQQLHNTDPQLMPKFYINEKQVVKKNDRRSKGRGKRSGAMEGVGLNLTTRSDGWDGNWCITLKTQSKSNTLTKKFNKHYNATVKDKKNLIVGGSRDGWLKDQNEMQRAKIHEKSSRGAIEMADNGSVLHKDDLIDYL